MKKAIFISGALNADNSSDFLHNCHLMMQYAAQIRELTPYYYNPIADMNVTLVGGCRSHKEWLDVDLFWLNKCDAIALVPNPNNKNSLGVKGEIEEAKRQDKPILKTLKEVKEYLTSL